MAVPDSILKPVKFRNSKLILHISGIQSGSGFEKEHFRLFVGNRPVLYASRYNDELAFFNPDVSLLTGSGRDAVFAKLHTKSSFYHQEHFVFRFMMMPGKGSSKLNQLKMLSV